MYEMWGAIGIEPWPHTWAEYKRLFTGWRRHHWEFAGHLCVIAANGLIPRKDHRGWQLSDFCALFKAAPKWKAKLRPASGLLKAVFCGIPLVDDAAKPSDGKDAS